jgi:hypothetical protein
MAERRERQLATVKKTAGKFVGFGFDASPAAAQKNSSRAALEGDICSSSF